jgi:hypothetical protein
MEVNGNFNRVAYGDINEFHLHISDAGALAKLLQLISDSADPLLTLVTDGNKHFSLRAGGASPEDLEARRREAKREMWWARWSAIYNRYSVLLLGLFVAVVSVWAWNTWQLYLIAPDKGVIAVLLPSEEAVQSAALIPNWIFFVCLVAMALAGGLLASHVRAAKLLQQQCREQLDMIEAEILRLKGRKHK